MSDLELAANGGHHLFFAKDVTLVRKIPKNLNYRGDEHDGMVKHVRTIGRVEPTTTQILRRTPVLMLLVGLLLFVLSACVEVVPVESDDLDNGARAEGDVEDAALEADELDDIVDLDLLTDGRDDLEDAGLDGAIDIADADDVARDAPADSTDDVDQPDQGDTADADDGDLADTFDVPNDDADPDASDTSDGPLTDPEVVIGCLSNDDCEQVDQVCSLVELSNGQLATECRDAAGSSPSGSFCFFDTTCESNHCLFGSACGAPCESEDDCPQPGDSCRELAITVADGGTPNNVVDDTVQGVDFCLQDAWGSLAPCASGADCGIGEECALFNDGRLDLERRCRPRNILGAQNGTCEVEEDCQTMTCIDGSFCFWACETNVDCEVGNRCHPTLYNGPSNEPAAHDNDAVNSCIPTCTSSEGCDSTKHCGWFASAEPQNELVQFCADSTGALDSGASCGTNTDCKSGVCGANSLCVGPCDPVGQTGCAGNTICYPSMVTITFDQSTDQLDDDRYDSFATCLPDIGSYGPCESDADCPDDETCTATANRQLTGFEPRCVSPDGSQLPGASCFNDFDCRSGICLTQGSCLGLCDLDGEGDAECSAGSTCQSSTVTIDFLDTVDNSFDDVSGPLDICQ